MSTDFEMAETDGRELIYEKDELLVDHRGSYPKHSFWDETGVAVTRARARQAGPSTERPAIESV